jgi:hypothetical protein
VTWRTASALNSGLNARRFLDIYHLRPSNIEGSEVSIKSRQGQDEATLKSYVGAIRRVAARHGISEIVATFSLWAQAGADESPVGP